MADDNWKTYLEARNANAQAAKTLRPGHLVQVGSLPTYVVESVDTTAEDWRRWMVKLVAPAGYTWTTHASGVRRVQPGQDTRNLRFGSVTHPLWAAARASYLGPICPDCGAAGAAIDDNGQGDYRCDDCTGEWRTDGKKVAL